MIEKPKSNRLDVFAHGRSQTKQESERNARFAKGGSGSANRMVREQAANPQKPGGTAHDVKGGAPGAKAAAGGGKTRGASTVIPSAPGRTAPPRKGR